MIYKRTILISYLLFNFIEIHSSSLPVQDRIQVYLNNVCAGKGMVPGDDSPSARSIALVKVALGIKEGGEFFPDEEAVLYLLKKQYLNPTIQDSCTGGTLLHFAAFYGACQVIQYLLEKNIPIEVDLEGQTPLHWAMESYNKVSRKEVIELLVSAKKDLVHARDFRHKTPLFNVSCFSEGGEKLLRLGADINAQDISGKSLLFSFKKKEEIKELCAHGIDVNLRDKSQLTALGGYLTLYSSAIDLIKDETINEIQKSIEQILYYGGYVPRMYHPAYKLGPLKSDYFQKERDKKMQAITLSFESILGSVEEVLVLLKKRLALSQKSSSLKKVSSLMVFDKYVAMLPFFESRYKEMKEIEKKETDLCSKEFSFNDRIKFKNFLSQFYSSKTISPEMVFMACDLIKNKHMYEGIKLLPEENRSAMGEVILSKLCSL
jgi:hypothetical protein